MYSSTVGHSSLLCFRRKSGIYLKNGDLYQEKLRKVSRCFLKSKGSWLLPEGQLITILFVRGKVCKSKVGALEATMSHCWLMEWCALTDHDPSETVSIVMQSS